MWQLNRVFAHFGLRVIGDDLDPFRERLSEISDDLIQDILVATRGVMDDMTQATIEAVFERVAAQAVTAAHLKSGHVDVPLEEEVAIGYLDPVLRELGVGYSIMPDHLRARIESALALAAFELEFNLGDERQRLVPEQGWSLLRHLVFQVSGDMEPLAGPVGPGAPGF